MGVKVIVMNGGSSSGKTGIARCLQAVLPDPWLAVGIDDLVDALPLALRAGDGAGITFGDDGSVDTGAHFRALEAAWRAGVAATARAGARIVVDDVFLGGAASQRRWRESLGGVAVLWVGVRCDPATAAARELARGDRVPGMAERQAAVVHEGVDYDIEVDTTAAEALACARAIAARLG
jgi:chloramphenicol 3-O phosphotransferase